MDALIALPLLSLPVLALIDSLSYGTLTIPVWLMLAPGRLRVGRMLSYLATIGGFYFVVGVLLLWGAESLLPTLGGVLNSDFGRVVLLVVGAALLWWSFALDSKRAKEKRARGEGVMARMSRWRASARDRSIVTLALAAGAIELLTMLPYLAAIGIISHSALAPTLAIGTLAGYCLVMLLPALVLLGARLALGHRADGILTRIDAWMTKHGDSALSWVVGILGVILIVNNLNAINLFS